MHPSVVVYGSRNRENSAYCNVQELRRGLGIGNTCEKVRKQQIQCSSLIHKGVVTVVKDVSVDPVDHETM